MKPRFRKLARLAFRHVLTDRLMAAAMGGNYVLLENYSRRSTDWQRRIVARIVADIDAAPIN